MPPKRKPAGRKTKAICLRVTQEDLRKLKADQHRKGAGQPSEPSYSEMAHKDWFQKLPDPKPKHKIPPNQTTLAEALKHLDDHSKGPLVDCAAELKGQNMAKLHGPPPPTVTKDFDGILSNACAEALSNACDARDNIRFELGFAQARGQNIKS